MQHSLTDLRPRSKLPTLHHKSLEWDGVRAKLRVYIIRWYDHLIDFEDTSAIMFLSRCVTPEFKELVLSYHELEPCLQNLATYCANKEMYCKRKLEEMKAAKLSRSYRDDKEMISMFDRKLIQITSIDSSFHIDFLNHKSVNS